MDVKQIRKKLGMRSVDFARALGVTITTVSRWENSFRSPDNRAVRDIVALLKGKSGFKTIRDRIIKENPFLTN